MYRPTNKQIQINEYTLDAPFKLDPTNRWVKRAEQVPWELAEQKYMHMFKKNGRPAKNIRMALGALIIQQIKGLSDEETVQEIKENPYLQYFIGMTKFTNEAPFDSSLMVWFRKRLSKKFMEEINNEMCHKASQPAEETPAKDEDDNPHGGTLIVDASCAPANIKYPTDTGLLADGIEKTDGMIDTMQECFKGKESRPRTYREKSRKLFVGFARQRKPSAKTIHKVKGKQLNYLKRNLTSISKMKEKGGILTQKQEKQLEIIQTLYNQQRDMHKNRINRINDRIVSISQPHIRPIVRGKAGTPVEFGAKVNISVVNGYTFLDHISYDAFYEGDFLENTIIDYYIRFGMLPSKVLVDQAYTSRENRKLCKVLGIKLSCKPLGRPPKDGSNKPEPKDYGRRSEVEGKFGTLKTKYGLNRVMPRLPDSGMTVIAVAIFAMNLVKSAKLILSFFNMCFVVILY